MVTRAFNNQTTTFDADGSSEPIFWPGGTGVLSIQGDMGGGSASLVATLKKSADGGDPATDTYAIATDSNSGDAATIAGPAAYSDLESVVFNLPSCYIKVTLSSATDPDFVAVIGRNPT